MVEYLKSDNYMYASLVLVDPSVLLLLQVNYNTSEGLLWISQKGN
ncbi:hypothetical protein SLEP1_g32184 [Rubroshorea leprosula]|uniref:Uncharacterized protein n=1 Tax=Rubroshorea leprosula TaxID=152421 RepID=A0AAV5KCG7_9ROSI|nr:hypothetical protein SLEP1_g32184 [Rubroshorea leprosula]